MKEFMINMMGMMMPYMKFPVYIGAVVGGIGLLMLLARLFTGKMVGLGFAGGVLVAIGIFYLACEGLGRWLGMGPTINFGDPTKFEFNTVEFWKLGIAMLVPGIIYKIAQPKKE